MLQWLWRNLYNITFLAFVVAQRKKSKCQVLTVLLNVTNFSINTFIMKTIPFVFTVLFSFYSAFVSFIALDSFFMNVLKVKHFLTLLTHSSFKWLNKSRFLWRTYEITQWKQFLGSLGFGGFIGALVTRGTTWQRKRPCLVKWPGVAKAA